ncbi:MAG: NUDIX hydrolase, partial [Pseudomonas fluorescens]
MADTYLSIVDDNDTVVGRELRSVIHKQGLRHREVHGWLILNDGKLVLQKRSATKDTYPNMLDASVGGHVEEAVSSYVG